MGVIDVDVVVTRQLSAEMTGGDRKPEIIQLGRMQLVRDPLDVSGKGRDFVVDTSHLVAHVDGALGQLFAQPRQLYTDERHPLADIVMELSGDARALLLLRRDKPARQIPD